MIPANLMRPANLMKKKGRKAEVAEHHLAKTLKQGVQTIIVKNAVENILNPETVDVDVEAGVLTCQMNPGTVNQFQ